MKIFQHKKIKKLIKLNIEKAAQIYDNIKKCLVPANNIYYCRSLDLPIEYEDLEHFKKFKESIPLFKSLIKEFKTFYFVNSKIYVDYPKLEDESSEYFIKTLDELQKFIEMRIDDFEKLDDFKTNNDFKETVKLLNKALGYVKAAIDDIMQEFQPIQEI